MLIAGAGMGVIVACYAEVASQFTATGGTYLYLRSAFGRLIGTAGRLDDAADAPHRLRGSVNLLVAYLGEFWPAATQPLPRLPSSRCSSARCAVNYRGVGAGTT